MTGIGIELLCLIVFNGPDVRPNIWLLLNVFLKSFSNIHYRVPEFAAAIYFQHLPMYFFPSRYVRYILF